MAESGLHSEDEFDVIHENNPSKVAFATVVQPKKTSALETLKTGVEKEKR
jgi:hypothetical protein